MKCRYNNHHHNNNCAYSGNDVIKLAIEHEGEYYCKYNPANIKNKELFFLKAKQSLVFMTRIRTNYTNWITD